MSIRNIADGRDEKATQTGDTKYSPGLVSGVIDFSVVVLLEVIRNKYSHFVFVAT